MSDYIPGVAFIINQQKNRDGSNKDVEQLQSTLQQMNVDVEVWSGSANDDTDAVSSLTDDEIKNKMKNLQSDEWRSKFAKYEYVIIAYFSHGTTDGRVLNAQSTAFAIQKRLLNPLFQIVELDKKLKWLIVQACRGESDYIGFKPDGKPKNYYTDYFLKSFSSMEGGRSYRRPGKGSIYIEKLCEQLQRNAGEIDLIAILEATAEDVLAYFKNKEHKLNFDDANAGFGPRPNFEDDDIRTNVQRPEVSKNFGHKFSFKHGWLSNDT